MIAYDVIVIDLDGTLLQPDGSVAPVDRAAVDRARAEGVEVVIATGRTFTETHAARTAIEHEGLVIGASGALVSDASSGRTLVRRTIEVEIVETVVSHVVESGHKALLLKDRDDAACDYAVVGAAPLHPVTQWWFDDHGLSVADHAVPDDDPHLHTTLRCGAMGGESDIAALSAALRPILLDVAYVHHWGAVIAPDDPAPAPHLLEVFPPACNKWTAVLEVCAMRGFDPRRVAAIGDGLNDVELIREAGLGVAVANATASVREVADRITADHRAGGVSLAIEQIVDGRW